MEVVCVVNAMYVAFDQLCEKHHVYKVMSVRYLFIHQPIKLLLYVNSHNVAK